MSTETLSDSTYRSDRFLADQAASRAESQAASVDFLARIRDASATTRDADAYLVDARRHRNALIVEAVDSGVLSQRAAARAAGLTQSRVIFLLAQAQNDED
jgi:hypothetical protein